MSKSPDFQALHDVAVVRGANFGAFALGIPIATTLYVQRQNRLLIRNIHPTWRMFLGGGALWGGGYLGIRCFLEAWEILGDTNQINAYLDGRQPSEHDVSRLQNYYGPRWKMTCQYLGGTPSSSFGIRSRATKKRKLEEESEIGSKELWPEIIDPALPAELNDVSLGAGLITARGMDPLTGRVIYRVSLVEPVVETIEDNPVQDDIYLVPSLELNSRGYTVEAIKPVQCIIFRFVLNIENEGSSLITVRYGMGSAVERTMTLAELKDQVASPTSCNAGLREAWSYFVRSHARFFSKHSLSAKHQISKAAQKVLSSSSSSSYYSSPSSSSLPPSEPIQGSIYSIPAEIPPDIFKVHQLVSSIHRP